MPSLTRSTTIHTSSSQGSAHQHQDASHPTPGWTTTPSNSGAIPHPWRCSSMQRLSHRAYGDEDVNLEEWDNVSSITSATSSFVILEPVPERSSSSMSMQDVERKKRFASSGRKVKRCKAVVRRVWTSFLRGFVAVIGEYRHFEGDACDKQVSVEGNGEERGRSRTPIPCVSGRKGRREPLWDQFSLTGVS